MRVSFPRMPVLDVETRAARDAAAGGAEKSAYVRRIFSEIAPSYDRLNHLLSLNVDRRWRRRALAALEWRRAPAGLYLDLCAGTLDVACELATARAFQGLVIGADFAEPMLRAGAAKVARLAVAPLAADALHLPLPDASVDGAIVAFGIRNVDDLDAVLAEIARVVRRGGRFVILELNTPPRALVRALYRFYFHSVLPFVGGLLSGHPTAYRYLPESVAHFPDAAALTRRLERAGWGNVRSWSLTMGIAALHVVEKR
jgi:demethylmenaquinone methyltransferase / 2-methoxy-6-polyprenyl-1,4-benzoquinol methylase